MVLGPGRIRSIVSMFRYIGIRWMLSFALRVFLFICVSVFFFIISSRVSTMGLRWREEGREDGHGCLWPRHVLTSGTDGEPRPRGVVAAFTCTRKCACWSGASLSKGVLDWRPAMADTEGSLAAPAPTNPAAVPAIPNLLPSQVVSKSKYRGAPSYRTLEGLPPPALDFQKRGGVYVWGVMADDADVSSLNTAIENDLAFSGFRGLAHLCGGLAPPLKFAARHEMPKCAQFSIALPEGVHPDRVETIAAGDKHIVFHTDEKKVYSAGFGTAALIDAQSSAEFTLSCVAWPDQKHRVVEAISCGKEHTIVVARETNSKTLRCYNFGGAQSAHAIPLVLRKSGQIPFVIGSHEYGNVAVIDHDGREYLSLWRNNVEGEVFVSSSPPIVGTLLRRSVLDGVASTIPIDTGSSDSNGDVPLQILASPAVETARHEIVQVQCGRRHILVLDSNGTVYWAGADAPSGSTSAPVVFPANVATQKKCVKISSGERHFAALFEHGRLCLWGGNEYSQVCENSFQFIADPMEAPLCDDTGVQLIVQDVACGNLHTVALASGGTIFGWGRTPNQGYFGGKIIPLADLAGQFVLRIGCGPQFGLAVIENPQLKLDARVIDMDMEIWRRCIQAKRAMFGLRSNFSPHYTPVTFFGNALNAKECKGTAVVFCRPSTGLPKDSSFADLAAVAHQAGATAVIFCCHGPKAVRAVAKSPVPSRIREIDIPVVSVSEEGGALLGCSACSSAHLPPRPPCVALKWFGDAP